MIGGQCQLMAAPKAAQHSAPHRHVDGRSVREAIACYRIAPERLELRLKVYCSHTVVFERAAWIRTHALNRRAQRRKGGKSDKCGKSRSSAAKFFLTTHHVTSSHLAAESIR
jgi:hypothetical protein